MIYQLIILGRLSDLTIDLDGQNPGLGYLYSAFSNKFYGEISLWTKSAIDETKNIVVQPTSDIGKQG